MVKENRTCKEICKRFIVKKSTSGSRYGAGQGRCQTCDVWIDYRGAHMKDGSTAAIDSAGWFCNCCNYRIRQKPRNKVYKEKLRAISQNDLNLKKPSKIIIKIKNKNLKKYKQSTVRKSLKKTMKDNQTKKIKNSEINTEIEKSETELIEKFGENDYFKEVFPFIKKHIDMLSKNKILEVLDEL